MRLTKDERGVALITVLLVGASLTAVTSVAAFTTIKEFRAGGDDRRAAEALSYAEAGLDRMTAYIRSGVVNFNDMNNAGCNNRPAITLPTGTIGNGFFDVFLSVYDPFATTEANKFPIQPNLGACANRPTTPHRADSDQTFFVMTSTGSHPDAVRVVRQVIAMEPIGLPIGIYANAITVQSDHHQIRTVSMVSETTISDRGSLSFFGTDPYYFMKDFFTGVSPGRSLDEHIPAAAHAAVGISVKKSGDPEFTGGATGTKNCGANDTEGSAVASQSLWDSDGSNGSGVITSTCSGQNGFPNSSVFTPEQLSNFARPTLSEQDHQTLKEAAQATGVYCSFPGALDPSGFTNCTVMGGVKAPALSAPYPTYIQNVITAGINNVLAYFEFRSGTPTQNNLGRTGTVWGCNDNPDLNRSLVAIVRNGGVNYDGASGDMVNGAFIMDGGWTSNGNFTFNGSLISKGLAHFHSSSQEYRLDECWLKNTPGPFLRVVPGHWSEVDR